MKRQAERDFKDEIKRMREASGNIGSDDPMVCFLYILTRDHLPWGVVESIIDQAGGQSFPQFTNGWVATHCIDAADRLKKVSGRAK